MKTNSSYGLYCFIFFIHAIYFLLAVLVHHHYYLVDSYGYLNQAKNILQHHSWYAELWNATYLPDYESLRPPLYAVFILMCKSITSSDAIILFVQNGISISSFIILVQLFNRLRVASSIRNTVIALGLLFCPSQLIYCNLIMSEVLLQLCLIAIVYYSIISIENPSVKSILPIACLVSVAIFIKPVSVLLPLVLIPFIGYQIIQKKKTLWLLAPFICVVISAHLLCLQNKHSTGYYHFSSAKILYDLRVNARYVLMNKYGEDSSHAFVEQVFKAADKTSNYEQRYAYIETACSKSITENKLTFTKLYLRGLLTFFIDPGRFDIYHFFGAASAQQGFLHSSQTEGGNAVIHFIKEAPWLILLCLSVVLVWNFFVLICLLYLLKHLLKTPIPFLLLIAMVGYFVIVCGMSGIARYRVPVIPEIILLIGYALEKFLTPTSHESA